MRVSFGVLRFCTAVQAMPAFRAVTYQRPSGMRTSTRTLSIRAVETLETASVPAAFASMSASTMLFAVPSKSGPTSSRSGVTSAGSSPASFHPRMSLSAVSTAALENAVLTAFVIVPPEPILRPEQKNGLPSAHAPLPTSAATASRSHNCSASAPSAAISGVKTPYWSSSMLVLGTPTVFSNESLTTVIVPVSRLLITRSPTHFRMPRIWLSHACCTAAPPAVISSARSPTIN